MKRLLIIFLPFLLANSLSAQDISAPKYLETLALEITKGAKDERQKVDAIFNWITDNIAYDVDMSKQGFQYPEFDLPPAYDTAVYHRQYSEAVARMVISNKKGICDGYARLFKVLCYYVDVECEYVGGVVRSFLSKEPAGHAWNAVKIKGKWYLVDPTWASGSVGLGGGDYKKDKKMFYYLTPPEKLIVDHYPDDPKWTLLNLNLSFENFLNQALQETKPFVNGLNDYFPKSKEITVSKDGLLKIWLDFDNTIDPNDISISDSNVEPLPSTLNIDLDEHDLDSLWAVNPGYFMKKSRLEIVETKVIGNRIEYTIKPLTDDLKGILIYI